MRIDIDTRALGDARLTRPITVSFPALRKVSPAMAGILLGTLRDLSGAQYATILGKANLAHLDGAPAGLTDAEVAALFASTHELMGEALTRLFFSNYGKLLAPRVLDAGLAEELRAAVAGAPAPGRKKAFVDGLVQLSTATSLGALKAWEDESHLHLSFDLCPFCARIRGSRSAICSSAATLWGALAQKLLGSSLSFEEYECVAAGGTRCRFRVAR